MPSFWVMMEMSDTVAMGIENPAIGRESCVGIL